jgi:pimeloyl-ACP methyl ester carboxylesterase
MLPGIEQSMIKTNGVRLHVVSAGPPSGRPVIFLHGFPEFWYGWRRQIPFFAAAGYRVIVPDQRGYNLSEKPAGVGSYRVNLLSDDIIGLIDALGYEKVVLVGHDWGAAVAWWTAAAHPERLEKLVILNVPHGRVMMEHLRRSPSQLLKSWYIFAFQLPWLPEQMARSGNWNTAAASLLRSSRPGTFTPEDMLAYRRAWSQPGAMTAMINWYRALVRMPPPALEPRIRVPTLMLWGVKDAFLGRELAPASIALCDQGRLEYLETTHWVQHEAPDRVNSLIASFAGTL